MYEYKFPGWDKIEDKYLAEEEKELAFNRVMASVRDADLTRKKSFSHWFAYAFAVAAIIIAPAIALFIVKHNPPQEIIIPSCEYTAAKGEIREVILPDQSRVILNSGSVLICPERFAGERSVFLSGEALFDVTASKENPFLVRTSDVNIRVYGTKFNVKSYFDDPDIRTTLCRGSVEVWAEGQEDNVVVLRPGESMDYDRDEGTITVSKVDPVDYILWESGELCFRSESIYDIMRIVERRFDVNIYLTTDKYDNARITARFVHGESLEELLKAITSVVPGMKYRIENDKVFLK